MSDLESPEELFVNWRQIPQFALFKSNDDGIRYHCLYSSLANYSEKVYSIYEIDELVRLVGKRMELFTSGLTKVLSEDKANLPIVLKWQAMERDIVILDLNSVETEIEGLQNKIEDIKEDLISWSHRQFMIQKQEESKSL